MPTDPAMEHFADLPGIDVAKGMDTWRDMALYGRFLQQFAIDHACSANQFGALLKADEWEAASALMHKLRGAAATLSLTGVCQAAAAIEDCNDTVAAAALLAPLRPALATAFASISQLAPARQPTVQAPPDRAGAAPLLAQLLLALEARAASQFGPLLLALMPLLPAGALGAVQDCLDSVNYHAAAALVHELAREHGIAIAP